MARNAAKLPRVQGTYTDTPLLDCSGRETVRENGNWKALAWVWLDCALASATIFLSVSVDDIGMVGDKHNQKTHVEKIDETS